MRRSSIPLLVTFGVLYSSPSIAFEGQYRGGAQGYRQELEIKKRGADSYNVELVVGTKGCSGAFDGIGRAEGATLAVRTPPPADPATDGCHAAAGQALQPEAITVAQSRARSTCGAVWPGSRPE